jgi:PhoPQ-activated pathogenicity-related protein
MAAPGGRELPETPTWAVALVVLVLVLISVALEHALHKLTHVCARHHTCATAIDDHHGGVRFCMRV